MGIKMNIGRGFTTPLLYIDALAFCNVVRVKRKSISRNKNKRKWIYRYLRYSRY